MSTISSLGKGITGTASTGVAVHSVPCRIKVEDGVRTAAVNNYFASNVRSNDTDLTASLRGRPLKGLELQIPAGYTGVVLEKAGHCDDNQGSGCELSESARISSLYYWTLGTTPSLEHRLPQALTWTHIAHSLHSPLPVDGK